jgi:hypothetical protein
MLTREFQDIPLESYASTANTHRITLIDFFGFCFVKINVPHIRKLNFAVSVGDVTRANLLSSNAAIELGCIVAFKLKLDKIDNP